MVTYAYVEACLLLTFEQVVNGVVRREKISDEKSKFAVIPYLRARTGDMRVQNDDPMGNPLTLTRPDFCTTAARPLELLQDGGRLK